MSERTRRCPNCRFSFLSLVNAGDFNAYMCSECRYSVPTKDKRPGNRPFDVCAYCDAPIDSLYKNMVAADHHLFLGKGVVHGGGKESIPVHDSCGIADYYSEGSPARLNAWNMIRERFSLPPLTVV